MMDTEAPKQARDKLPEHGHREGVGAESLSAAHALLVVLSDLGNQVRRIRCLLAR